VIGLEKSRWHLRAGIDRNLFARLLVQICLTVNPAVTLIDGILALEGQGPGKGGTPRRLGILAAGTDPVALDFAVARMLGCSAESLPVHQAAVRLGRFSGPPEIIGTLPPAVRIRLPELGSAGFGPPAAQKLMRKHLLRRPRVDETKCRVCGICEKQCPARAVTTRRETVTFDYNRCIRCYCCVEVCPHGALSTMEPLAGRMFRQLQDWTRQAIHAMKK
jgi:ferredoxin